MLCSLPVQTLGPNHTEPTSTFMKRSDVHCTACCSLMDSVVETVSGPSEPSLWRWFDFDVVAKLLYSIFSVDCMMHSGPESSFPTVWTFSDQTLESVLYQHNSNNIRICVLVVSAGTRPGLLVARLQHVLVSAEVECITHGCGHKILCDTLLFQ